MNIIIKRLLFVFLVPAKIILFIPYALSTIVAGIILWILKGNYESASSNSTNWISVFCLYPLTEKEYEEQT